MKIDVPLEEVEIGMEVYATSTPPLLGRLKKNPRTSGLRRFLATPQGMIRADTP